MSAHLYIRTIYKFSGGVKMDNDKIEEAIKMLEANGYKVVHLSEDMIEDIADCEKRGLEKDCCGCSCDLCLKNA